MGDWLCSSTEDSPNENTGFKPVCQKTKNTDGNAKDPDGDDYDCGEYDEYCDDEEEDQNANLEEGPAKCIAPDTSYKFGGKKNIIEKIKGVGSFQECQMKCAEESECKYWKFKKNGKCILSRDIKRNGFIKDKKGVYSGTILNGSIQTPIQMMKIQKKLRILQTIQKKSIALNMALPTM